MNYKRIELAALIILSISFLWIAFSLSGINRNGMSLHVNHYYGSYGDRR
jgi:hypothetical protein